MNQSYYFSTVLRYPTNPTPVYIEAKVCGPGEQGKFLPHDKHKENSETVTKEFRDFMESEANILLLSGAAGSGKSTAYGKLQMYILNEYTKKRKEEAVSLTKNDILKLMLCLGIRVYSV